MKDRVPAPGKAGRVRIVTDSSAQPTFQVIDGRLKLIYEDETAIEGVLEHADDATVAGSVYNRANVLPDSVCDALGLDRRECEPKDAYLALLRATGNGSITVRAYAIDGTAYSNVRIGGLPEAAYTNDSGTVTVFVPAGSYTLTSAVNGKYLDCEMLDQKITVTVGQNTALEWHETAKAVQRANILATSGIRFSKNVQEVDVFCVGGGGGSPWHYSGSDTVYPGGGGGGYTKTGLNISITPEMTYGAMIGEGGKFVADSDTGIGGNTSFLGVIAEGGQPGSSYCGGDGGSGGAAPYGKGGSDGSDGSKSPTIGGGWTPGEGQGTTTKPFGDESESIAYAGGGGAYGAAPGALGGGAYMKNGTPNTGGGGGGGSVVSTDGAVGTATKGGSGIIIVRWRNKA